MRDVIEVRIRNQKAKEQEIAQKVIDRADVTTGGEI